MPLDSHTTPLPPEGLFYDDLHVGLRFPEPAGVTVDGGLAALYTAISGDGLALTVDRDLCREVTGREALLVNPALIMHVSIGASTVATRNVIGNLFYRNVVLARAVFRGETLHTTTGVAALSDARAKPGAAPRGKALLSIRTSSGDDVVVDYERCPLLPCRGDRAPGHMTTTSVRRPAIWICLPTTRASLRIGRLGRSDNTMTGRSARAAKTISVTWSIWQQHSCASRTIRQRCIATSTLRRMTAGWFTAVTRLRWRRHRSIGCSAAWPQSLGGIHVATPRRSSKVTFFRVDTRLSIKWRPVMAGHALSTSR